MIAVHLLRDLLDERMESGCRSAFIAWAQSAPHPRARRSGWGLVRRWLCANGAEWHGAPGARVGFDGYPWTPLSQTALCPTMQLPPFKGSGEVASRLIVIVDEIEGGDPR